MHVAWSINEKDLKTLKSTEKIYIFSSENTRQKQKQQLRETPNVQSDKTWFISFNLTLPFIQIQKNITFIINVIKMFWPVLRTEMWLTGFEFFFFYRYILMSTFWSHLHTKTLVVSKWQWHTSVD